MSKLEKKLEEFKMLGMYSVSLDYGEQHVGCDDMSVEPGARRVRMIGYPVGCLGEAKVLYVGSLGDLNKFDLKSRPTPIGNPPEAKEYKDAGYYIWGTLAGVDNILKTMFRR